MEIPLMVLVLQIGFNAALNNHGYTSNPVIPSPLFVISGQTRRLPETDSYFQLSSRGIPESDEQTDSGYSSSFEDYSYRSVRSQPSRPNQRKNDDTPEGRINSNNQFKNLQQSYSSSRRTDPYLRGLYLRDGLSNLSPDHTRQNYRKANDDSSLEVSSLESNNDVDASRLGEEANYLRSLLSLVEQPNNRRDQSRKYYRQGNSLSIDESPIDKLDADEYNLPNGLNNRRNNNPDAYVDSILLVADDDNPDEIPIGNPKSESTESMSPPYNKMYNRRYDDGLNLDEEFTNNLLPFRGRERSPIDQTFEHYNPIIRRFNRKSKNNAGIESPLNDNTGKLTALRLASLEDLNLESSLLRSGNNRKNNHRNILRLSLSPDNKLTLDESVASDLSEILSETLDKLHLAPVNLRRTDLPNNKYSRRKNNRLDVEGNNLRIGSSHIPKPASPLQRYRGLANRSTKRNLRTHGNHTRQVLKNLSPIQKYRDPDNHSSNRSLRTHGNHTRQVHKKIFDEDTAKTLVPYHEGNSNKLPNNRKHEHQNNNRGGDGSSDEFSLDTLFAFRKEGNLSYDLTTNHDNLSLEPSLLRSSDEIIPKNDGVLHLEYPWNDPLSPDGDSGKLQLRTNEKKDTTKDTSDILHLEFPWNEQLSSNAEKGKSQLRSDDEKDKSKDTANALHLEFPWNDAVSPDGDEYKLQLRNDEKKYETEDTTDTLDLEFPWNNVLRPDSDKHKSKLRTDEKKEKTKDTTDTLHLEFPWNEQLSPNAEKGKSQLRSDDEKDKSKDTANALHLEFPWNDAVSPDGDENKLQLRNDEKKDETEDTTDTLDLEFPWNNVLRPDSDKHKSKLRTDEKKEKTKDTTDTLQLEFPWNDAMGPDGDKDKSKLRTDEQKDETKDTNDILKLEFPWNVLSSDSNKEESKLRTDEKRSSTNDTTDILDLEYPWHDQHSPGGDKGKSKLWSDDEKNNTNDAADTLNLEFPWNDALNPDSDKDKKQLRSKDETKDTLHLEYPWNDQLSPDEDKTVVLLRSDTDNRQEKEPKDDLKLEFPWNDQTSPNKPSSQKTLRIPDPFYVHPYLRNRNVNKHPNYFERSYGEYNEGLRFKNLNNRRTNSHPRQSKRRRSDDLEVIGLSRRSSEEDPSKITFPSDRKPHRLQSDENNPPLKNRNKSDGKTYNDNIVFPKN